MVDVVKRRMLFDLLVAYMKGDIKAERLSNKGFECLNKKDATLTEIFYRLMKDRSTYVDHYIAVIKVDWHYYVQMATFLLSDRGLEEFHFHDPKRSSYETFTAVFLGIIIPLSIYIFLGILWSTLFMLLSVPLLIAVVLLGARMLRKQANSHNCFPEQAVPHYWPYQCEADFEADYLKFQETDDIPLERPDLTGKVHKVSKEDMDGIYGVSAMPDEF